MHIISIMFFSMSWISKISLNVQIYICVCTPCINICLYIYIYRVCIYTYMQGVYKYNIWYTYCSKQWRSAKSVLSSGQLEIIPSATKGLLGFCILVWVHYKCLCESNNESIIILFSLVKKKKKREKLVSSCQIRTVIQPCNWYLLLYFHFASLCKKQFIHCIMFHCTIFVAN